MTKVEKNKIGHMPFFEKAIFIFAIATLIIGRYSIKWKFCRNIIHRYSYFIPRTDSFVSCSKAKGTNPRRR
jgi:hypothetical protein